MNQPRIEVTDLVVRYGDVTAVDGIGFDIAPGELVTLLGPSGCGKTTTLRAVAGLETPSSGSIRLNGQTVFGAAERRNVPAEKRGVSMVFQSYAIWPHMTVFDNVAFGLRARGAKRAAIADAVQRSLGQVGLAHLADRPATRLSGGRRAGVLPAIQLYLRTLRTTGHFGLGAFPGPPGLRGGGIDVGLTCARQCGTAAACRV